PDTLAREAARGERVKKCWRRRDREIATILRPRVPAFVSDKRSCNHARDVVRCDEYFAGELTAGVEIRERNHFLVRRDLKNRVGGGVEDPGARALMLGAKTIDDCRPAAGHVADHSASGALDECAHESRGEAVRIGREGTLELYAGDLPVASGAVLPRRMRHHEAPCPDRLAHGWHPRERRDVAQAGALQVGKL